MQNPTPGAVYTWSISGGGVVQPSSNDTLYVNWGTVPGIYTVSVFGVAGATCVSDTTQYGVQILPVPTLQIQGNTDVCVGAKITLTATGTNQVVWSSGVSGTSADFFPSGNTRVWAVGTDGTCPSDTAFFNLTPVPLPAASFSANPVQGEAPLNVSFIDQSSNAVTYFWDFGNGVTSTQKNPTNLYQKPGMYPVTLITENAAGCRDSIKFEFIVVNEAFSWYIPNSFTPNGDNTNETFHPYFPDFVEYTLGIYDRWGNAIFRSTSVSDYWDGTLDKKQVPSGVYTYRILFRTPVENKLVEKIGSVTLIR